MSKPAKSFKLSIPINLRESKYFICLGKKYKFDFELFEKNSNFFFKNHNLYQNVECIELLNEKESKMFHDISDTAINNFISLAQNQDCEICDSDIFYIHYLSIKFDVFNLTKILSDYISQNQKELFLDSFLFKVNQNYENKYNYFIF